MDACSTSKTNWCPVTGHRIPVEQTPHAHITADKTLSTSELHTAVSLEWNTMEGQSDDGREIQRAIRTNVLQIRFVCNAAITKLCWPLTLVCNLSLQHDEAHYLSCASSAFSPSSVWTVVSCHVTPSNHRFRKRAYTSSTSRSKWIFLISSDSEILDFCSSLVCLMLA